MSSMILGPNIIWSWPCLPSFPMEPPSADAPKNWQQAFPVDAVNFLRTPIRYPQHPVSKEDYNTHMIAEGHLRSLWDAFDAHVDGTMLDVGFALETPGSRYIMQWDLTDPYTALSDFDAQLQPNSRPNSMQLKPWVNKVLASYMPSHRRFDLSLVTRPVHRTIMPDDLQVSHEADKTTAATKQMGKVALSGDKTEQQFSFYTFVSPSKGLTMAELVSRSKIKQKKHRAAAAMEPCRSLACSSVERHTNNIYDDSGGRRRARG